MRKRRFREAREISTKMRRKLLAPPIFRASMSALIAGLVLLFGAGQMALADITDSLLTKSDIQKVLRTFSTGPCNISEFSKSSQNLGFEPVWTEYDDLEEMPLTALDQDSLCLIALSSSFQSYQRTKNGGALIVAGPENAIPENKPVVEVTFYLPRRLAPQSCVKFEGATVPYVVTISKSHGKLKRDIRRTDADEACFVAEVKKNGLGAK